MTTPDARAYGRISGTASGVPSREAIAARSSRSAAVSVPSVRAYRGRPA